MPKESQQKTLKFEVQSDQPEETKFNQSDQLEETKFEQKKTESQFELKNSPRGGLDWCPSRKDQNLSSIL